MNRLGNKDQIREPIEFKGIPQEVESVGEKSRWRAFLDFVNPWANRGKALIKTAKELGKEHVQTLNEINKAEAKKRTGEAIKSHAEAEKIKEEAAEIAARKSNEKVKAVNDEIVRIFSDESLPDQAKALMLANVMNENPEISAQLEKIIDMMSKLQLVNFAEINISVQENTSITEKRLKE